MRQFSYYRHAQAEWSTRAPTLEGISDPRASGEISKSQTSCRYHETVILKPIGGLNITNSASSHVSMVIIKAAKLTQEECAASYVKLRPYENLIVADTHNPLDHQKLLQDTAASIHGNRHELRNHTAIKTGQVKGVIHGALRMTNEEVMANIDPGNRTLIAAHTMGKTNTAVLKYEGIYPTRGSSPSSGAKQEFTFIVREVPYAKPASR